MIRRRRTCHAEAYACYEVYMIGSTISHYPPEADSTLRDKILLKLGEGGPVPLIPPKAMAEALLCIKKGNK